MDNLSETGKKRLEKVRKILRRFLQDTPELNRLLRRKELDDGDLDIAIELAISDWNATPPPLTIYTIETFPNLFLLITGSAVNALRMAGLYHARNQLTYQALGSSFTRHDKTQYYFQWMNSLAKEWEQKKQDTKIAQNVAGGFGGIHSEYFLIGYDF